MRILILCESADGKNGWSVYTRQLTAEMRRDGHEVRICTADDASEGLRLPQASRMISRPWTAWTLSRGIRRLCDTWHPDIVHVTVEPYVLIAAFLPPKLCAKTVWTAHGSYGVRLLLDIRTRLLARRSYARTAHCIAVSTYTKSAVGRALTRHAGPACLSAFLGKTAVIPNAVTAADIRERAPRTGAKTIVCVGGVKPRKGILEALDGCAVYRDHFGDDFRFEIVGTADPQDSYVQRVHDSIKAHGLERHVTLRGVLQDDELDALYRSADLFLMPAKTTETTFEGFGIVFLEANARGVPVIGPKDSGAAEAIAEGQSGFHVDPGDANAIAQRIHDILDNNTIEPAHCIAWAAEHDVRRQWGAVASVYALINPSTFPK